MCVVRGGPGSVPISLDARVVSHAELTIRRIIMALVFLTNALALTPTSAMVPKLPCSPWAPHSRRSVLAGLLASTCFCSAASAQTGLGYIDDAGAKSYSSVQRAWEKSATMTEREKKMAARGVASNVDRATESVKSQKRRSMAGCKDEEYRSNAGYSDEAACNKRVLAGDVTFMLDVMDAE